MHALASTVLVVALAAPDPRTIDPDANRPDIVTEGGATAAPVIPTVPPPADGSAPTTTAPPAVPDRPPPAPGSSGTTTAPPVTPPAGPPPAGGTSPGGGQPKVTPPPPDPEPDVDRTVGCFPARGRCRRLNVAGFATLGVGVALLGTGIAFTQVAPFPQDDEPVFNRSLAPPGKALVGVGVAAVLAGALLIGSGFAVHRKFQSGEDKLARRGRNRQRTARVAIDAGGLHW